MRPVAAGGEAQSGGAIYRLVGDQRTAPPDAESPFVGRVAERALLEQRWAAAQAGRGAALLVIGEPGIGKSRLVGELSRRLRPTSWSRAVARRPIATARCFRSSRR